MTFTLYTLHLLFLGYLALVLTHLVLQVGCASLLARRARRLHEAGHQPYCLVWP